MADVWHALADPWREPLIRRAFLEVALIGVTGGALGCWVVLYGLSYGAESLAHGLFPGLVLAALTGIPLVAGGAVGLVVAALAIALAGRVPAIGADNAVAVVITTLFGLGALLALSRASPPGLGALLFGDVLGTSDSDLWLAAGLGATVLVGLRLLHWRLLATGFDRGSARALGVAPLPVEIALLVLLALAVLVGVQGLGNLLVVAVLIAPAAAARLVTRRMAPMMVASAATAVLAGIGGLYLSYYARVATGAAIAGAMIALYLLAAAAAATTRAAPRTAGR